MIIVMNLKIIKNFCMKLYVYSVGIIKAMISGGKLFVSVEKLKYRQKRRNLFTE